jgi:WD40 repeat protein
VGGKQAYVWDVDKRHLLGPPIDHQGEYGAVAMLSDNTTVVTGGPDNTICLWNAETGKRLGAPICWNSMVTAIAISHDDALVVVGGVTGSLGLVDVTARSIRKTAAYDAGRIYDHFAKINAITFVKDSKLFVTCSDDRTARLWHAEGFPIGPSLPHDNALSDVDTSDILSLIATSSVEGEVKLWNLPQRITVHPTEIQAYVYSITGMTGDGQGVVAFIDKEKWAETLRSRAAFE